MILSVSICVEFDVFLIFCAKGVLMMKILHFLPTSNF